MTNASLVRHGKAFAACLTVLIGALGIAVLTGVARAHVPKPSAYPISWELMFEHSKPRRVVVEVPGHSVPQAYWYITYTVTNNTDSEQSFLPMFELLTRDGKVIRSDRNISPRVFEVIKGRERNNHLQTALQVAGELRIGEDQAKHGVAIWREPDTRMGTFSIFVTGLSGEIATLKDDKGEAVKDKDGQPVILRKTLQLTYQIPGDEVFPGEDAINERGSTWVMR